MLEELKEAGNEIKKKLLKILIINCGKVIA